MSLTRGLVLDVANQLGGAMPGLVTLHDWSREKNDGTMANVTWNQEPTSLWTPVFNGTNSKVTTANFWRFGSGSIETWCIPDFNHDDVGAINPLFGYRTASGKYIDVYFDGTNNWLYSRWRGTTSYPTVTPTVVFHAGDPLHVVVTALLGAFMIVYVNGEEVARDNHAPNGVTAMDTLANYYMGAGNGGGPPWFDGRQPLNRAFNYVLTPAQIRSRYHSTKWLFGVAS